MSGILRFFRQSLVSYKSMFGYTDLKVYILVKIISPTFQMLFFCYLAKYVYHTDDMAPWVIGNAFMVCVFNIFLGSGLIMMLERNFGTLKILIATTTSRFEIFFSRSIMHIFDAMYTVIFNLFVGILVFKIDFSGVNLWLFGLVILVAMFSAISLGMIVSGFGLLVRDINMIINIGIIGLIGLSGSNIPIDSLPVFLQKVSSILPVTRSIKAGRLLADKAASSEIYPLMIQEMLLGCVLMVIGYVLFGWLENQARKYATLDVF